MPVYDYACTRCGRVVEVVHAVEGTGPSACETCGGAMKKLLSPPAVHFKGSGWAKKDRRSASTTKAAGKEAKPAGSTEASTSAGASESTTAAEPAATTGTATAASSGADSA
jgi:putative FmdB family regulatory protein